MSKPIKYNQLQINQFSFEEPKVSKSGTKSIKMLYNHKKTWNFVTPKLPLAFDVKPNDKGIYQLSLTFSENSPDFQELCSQLDQFMIEQGVTNSHTWLGSSHSKPFSREVTKSKYKPIVKHSKDKETGEINQQYAPRFQVTLPTNKDGQVTCEMYDEHSELLNINPKEILLRGVQCVALVSGSVWSNSANGYGITWRAYQLKVYPKAPQKCLLSDSEEGDQ